MTSLVRLFNFDDCLNDIDLKLNQREIEWWNRQIIFFDLLLKEIYSIYKNSIISFYEYIFKHIYIWKISIIRNK